MHALEISENRFFPIVPILFEQMLPVLRRRSLGERPVKRPNRAFDVRTNALVCGINVAERGGVEKNSVPGGLRTSGVGEAFKRKVRRQPRGVYEIPQAREALDKVRGQKSRRSKNDKVRLVFRVACENADAAICRSDAMNHRAGANIPANPLQEAASDPTVSFGPRERALLFRFPRREIMDTGPRGSIFGESS